MMDNDSGSAIQVPIHNIPAPPTKESVMTNSHVLVKYTTQKKTNIHYVRAAAILQNGVYKINIIGRAKGTAASFIYPYKGGVDDKIKLEEIVMHIGNPISIRGTSRFFSRVMFSVDRSNFNIQSTNSHFELHTVESFGSVASVGKVVNT